MHAPSEDLQNAPQWEDGYCEVCDRDPRTTPGLILTRWHDMLLCMRCFKNALGKNTNEA